MPLWLAALVTTVLYAVVAGVLALRGRDELKETGSPIPERHQGVSQGGHPVGEDTRAIEGQIEETRERMGDTVAALSYKADVPGRMRDSVSEKKDAVTGKLSSAKDAVMGSAGDAASGAQDGSKRVIGIAQENPLGLAIGAAAVGFVVGSLLPGTRVEEERIGPCRHPGARTGDRGRLRRGRARKAGRSGCRTGGHRRCQAVRAGARRAASRVDAGHDAKRQLVGSLW